MKCLKKCIRINILSVSRESEQMSRTALRRRMSLSDRTYVKLFRDDLSVMSDSDFIRELLECSVCLDQLDVTSRVLPCQHTFCKRCLEGIVEAHKELRCPECRIVVAGEVCDLPTNILLIRLLDGLKKNPKFVPKSTRGPRSNSRPAFRIAKEIFFQSSSPPKTQPPLAPVSHALHKQIRLGCSHVPREPQLRQHDAGPASGTTRAACDISCPKPVMSQLAQRRAEVPTCERRPRVVPPADPYVSGLPLANRTTNRMPVKPDITASSSINLRAFDVTPTVLFPSVPFSRSNSHDYLASVHQLPWNQIPLSSRSNRTKSLSRPSSRVNEKHSSLPARTSVSPTPAEARRPATLGLSKAIYMECRPSTSMTIGNPLYGYTKDRGKPEGLIFEPRGRGLDLNQVEAGRCVKALYGCVAETFNELSFEPEAVITDVQSSGEDGWLIGNYRGRRGLLPSNYVQDFPRQEPG